MKRQELLTRVKAALAEAFGQRLRGVVLYGSEARGQADPDSDIDLLVLLSHQDSYWDDVGRCIEAVYPLVLENNGRPIHAKPIPIDEYEAQEFGLYRNVRREGITL
jgi:predicted nucleotidyltransferase